MLRVERVAPVSRPLLAVLILLPAFAAEAPPEPLLRLETGREIRAAAFSPDGKILAASSRDGIALWDIPSGKPLSRIPPPSILIRVTSLAFSPDGTSLAACGQDDGAVYVYEVAGGKSALSGRLSGNLCATFSPDGSLIASGGEGVLLWSIAKGKERLHIPLPKSRVDNLAFSPDGRLLATGGSNNEGNRAKQFCVWETATGKAVWSSGAHSRWTPFGHQDRVEAVAFSPDGLLLASAGETGKIFLWDPESGRPIASWHAGTEAVNALRFSPDSRLLLAGGGEPDARVWALDPERELARFGGKERKTWMMGIAVGPDGLAATGNEHGEILVWKLPVAPLPAPSKAGDLEALWKDLPGPEGFRAARKLEACAAESVAFLAKRLTPAPSPAERVPALVADLDAPEAARREAASQALEALGPAAFSALHEALLKAVSEEQKTRLETLLESTGYGRIPEETLRACRAAAVLERIGTPEAGALLEKMALGAPGAWETEAARRALARLKRR